MLTSTLGATTRTFTCQGTTPRVATASHPAMTMAYDAAGNELESPAGDPSSGPAAVHSPRNLLQEQYRNYDRYQEEYGSACMQPDVVDEWTSNVYDGRGVRVLSSKHILGELSVDPNDAVYFYTPELTMLNIVAPATGRTADVIWFGSRPVADDDGTAVRYTFTDHVHYFQRQQIPSNCDCFWKNLQFEAGPPPVSWAVPLPTSDPWP